MSTTHYKRAIALLQPPIWAYIQLADALEKNAQLDEAIAAYQKANVSSTSTSTRWKRANALQKPTSRFYPPAPRRDRYLLFWQGCDRCIIGFNQKILKNMTQELTPEQRLTQIEKILTSAIKLSHSNTAKIDANTEAINALTNRVDGLTEQMGRATEMFIDSMGVIRTMQTNIENMQTDIREMQSEIRGLQVENRRIIDRVFGEDN